MEKKAKKDNALTRTNLPAPGPKIDTCSELLDAQAWEIRVKVQSGHVFKRKLFDVKRGQSSFKAQGGPDSAMFCGAQKGHNTSVGIADEGWS